MRRESGAGEVVFSNLEALRALVPRLSVGREQQRILLGTLGSNGFPFIDFGGDKWGQETDFRFSGFGPFWEENSDAFCWVVRFNDFWIFDESWVGLGRRFRS